MTGSQLRCTALIREYAIVAPTLPDAVLHRDVPCNLPIEGYGPCAFTRLVHPAYAPWECHADRDNVMHQYGHHTYQPSQWRHEERAVNTWVKDEFDHEAKP